MSHGVRFAITYHGRVAVAWVLLTAAYVALAALHAVAALAVVVALFAAVAAWCALLVVNAGGRWNDFRGRKRLAAWLGVLLVGTLAGGVSLGWWLTS